MTVIINNWHKNYLFSNNDIGQENDHDNVHKNVHDVTMIMPNNVMLMMSTLL